MKGSVPGNRQTSPSDLDKQEWMERVDGETRVRDVQESASRANADFAASDRQEWVEMVKLGSGGVGLSL